MVPSDVVVGGDSGAFIGDLLRTVTLILGGGLFLMAAIVNLVYVRLYLHDRKLAAAQGVTLSWRGLLPVHVAAVSGSYMLLVAHAFIATYRAVGSSIPLRWQTAVICAAYILGFIALRKVLRYQKRVYPRRPADPENPPAIDPPDEPECPFRVK